jgi:hypothetical protein
VQTRGGSLAALASLVCALAAALLALAPVPASAVLVTLPGQRTVSYQPLLGSVAAMPFDQTFSNLDYNGGPVMPANTNYAVYWQPSGAPAYPAEYQSGLDQYFDDLAHDSGASTNVDSVSAQYNDASGAVARYESHFGGVLLDTDPYPANGCTRAPICLTDAQLRTELTKLVQGRKLPTDLEHEYFLITPPTVEDCFTAAGSQCSAGTTPGTYCAYHGNIPLSEGGQIIYANDPYVTGVSGCDDGNHPNGKPSDGALEGGLSHEHNESVTDPEPNTAWTDFGGSGGEVGDKCRSSLGAPLGEVEVAGSKYKYNQVLDGHFYWYQQEWSNQGNECRQRLSYGGVQPSAAFTWEAAAGTEVKFDASTSLAPGRSVVRYNWQWNEGGTPGVPEETTSPTITHAFAAGGYYDVALTIFTEDGTEAGAGTGAGTAHLIIAGSPPAPVITRVTPAKGPPEGGTAVIIRGSGFTGASSVGFGALPAATFTVLSPTEITAVTPESAAGVVNVSVTNAGGTSAAGTATKYKFSPTTVLALSPATGPTAGGTKVTITGSGFALGAGATTFKFGSAIATGVECSSHRSCIAFSPKHAAGVVEVKAKVNGLASPKDPPADQFTYG